MVMTFKVVYEQIIFWRAE